MAALTKTKLQNTLMARLKLEKPKFFLEKVGQKFSGSIISSTFNGMKDLQRQKIIWDALDAECGASSVHYVGTLLAYSPDEWHEGDKTSSSFYVWEKMYVAIGCMCSDGPFMRRLQNATLSALGTLEVNDLRGALAQDLRFILGWTKLNIRDGKIQSEPGELDRQKLIEKMLHVMLETHPK